MSDIGMDSDVDIRTLPISEWQFSVRHILPDIGITDVDVGCRISDIADIKIDVNVHLCLKPKRDCTYASGEPALGKLITANVRGSEGCQVVLSRKAILLSYPKKFWLDLWNSTVPALYIQSSIRNWSKTLKGYVQYFSRIV